jgi:hypothetical protein
MSTEQKWCYACPDEGKLKCAMDYKHKNRRDFEKVMCKHLSQGKDKETCEYYLPTKKYR